MNSDAFSADFLNDIVTICIVVLFAKFATHRSRNRATGRTQWHRSPMLWHIVCIVCAVTSLVCGMIAIDQRSASEGLRYTAAGFLVVGCVILIADSFVQDHRRRQVTGGLQGERQSADADRR